MTKKYKFQIDTFHLSSKFYKMYEGWVPIEVDLTEEEFEQLKNGLVEWRRSEEWAKCDQAYFDDEYWINKKFPEIRKRVRTALEQQAPSIWGKKILPELYDVDIHCPEVIYEYLWSLEEKGKL